MAKQEKQSETVEAVAVVKDGAGWALKTYRVPVDGGTKLHGEDLRSICLDRAIAVLENQP